MDPANLAILLEGWRCFELRGHTGSIRPGSRVQLRQRVGPLSFDLEFVHFVLEPPECFGERQVRGPFARFEHIHEFHEDSGGTRIVDRVDFALPWYLGGRLADRLFARPELVRFFEFRRKAYDRLLQDGRLS
jgi:ligand-binding SRPBCC domain-containing protein